LLCALSCTQDLSFSLHEASEERFLESLIAAREVPDVIVRHVTLGLFKAVLEGERADAPVILARKLLAKIKLRWESLVEEVAQELQKRSDDGSDSDGDAVGDGDSEAGRVQQVMASLPMVSNLHQSH
jgi:hypothetical protein